MGIYNNFKVLQDFYPQNLCPQNLQGKQTLHKKMKFSINDFFSKCEEILNGKLHFF